MHEQNIYEWEYPLLYWDYGCNGSVWFSVKKMSKPTKSTLIWFDFRWFLKVEPNQTKLNLVYRCAWNAIKKKNNFFQLDFDSYLLVSAALFLCNFQSYKVQSNDSKPQLLQSKTKLCCELHTLLIFVMDSTSYSWDRPQRNKYRYNKVLLTWKTIET